MNFFSIPEGKQHCSYFGLEMTGTARKPVVYSGTSNVQEWKDEQDSWRRKMAAVLAASPYEKELELRFIGLGARGEGKLKIFILGRACTGDPGRDREILSSTWRDLHAMLRVNRNIYTFNPITKKNDLLGCLDPFQVNHTVELCRNGIHFRPQSTTGFHRDARPEELEVTLPLTLTGPLSNLGFLSRFLAEHPYPLMVSIRVSPYDGPLPDLSSLKVLEDLDNASPQQVKNA